jgi:hypothetical protein
LNNAGARGNDPVATSAEHYGDVDAPTVYDKNGCRLERRGTIRKGSGNNLVHPKAD